MRERWIYRDGWFQSVRAPGRFDLVGRVEGDLPSGDPTTPSPNTPPDGDLINTPYGVKTASPPALFPFRQVMANVGLLDTSLLVGPNGTRTDAKVAGVRQTLKSGWRNYDMTRDETACRLNSGVQDVVVTVTDNTGGTKTYRQPIMAVGRNVDKFSDRNLTGDGEWLYVAYAPGTSRDLQFAGFLPGADKVRVEIVQQTGTTAALSQKVWEFTNTTNVQKFYITTTVTIPSGCANMEILGFRVKVTIPSRPDLAPAWGAFYYLQQVIAAAPVEKQTLPTIFPAAHWSRTPAAAIPVASASDGWTSTYEGVTTTAQDSTAIVNELFTQASGRIGLTTNKFAGAIYVVDGSTPLRDIRWDDFYNFGWDEDKPGMRGVPVPVDAVPSNGTDGHVGFYRPDTDQWWEFWQFRHESDGTIWAATGGRVDNFSKGQGQNKLPNQWPYFTVSASGLALYPTVLKTDEVVRALRDYDPNDESKWDGHINHVLNCGLPAPKKYDQCWPATATDGNRNTSVAPWEGQRFSIDPNLDLRSLGLSKGSHILARAIQKYGVMTTETAGSVSIGCQSGYAWKLATGVDPYEELFTRDANGNYSGTAVPWDMLSKVPKTAWRAHRIYKSQDEFYGSLKTVTVTATETASGTVAVKWSPIVTAYVERDGVDVHGGGVWGTTNTTGTQEFSLLKPGDTYTFTVTTQAGWIGKASLTTASATPTTPTTGTTTVWTDRNPNL